VDDVLSALLFLKGSGYTRIGLFGSSFGGMASILAASQSDYLSLLALKSPVSDYKSMALTQRSDSEIHEWKENGFIDFESVNHEKKRLSYAFYEDARNLNAYAAARKIRVPTLIVHGQADETVPVEQSHKAASLIPDCRLVTLKGCDHLYSEPEHFKQLLDLVSQFVVEIFQSKNVL
jgi:hypothetical protein